MAVRVRLVPTEGWQPQPPPKVSKTMTTLSLVITINSAPSTGITFTPASPFTGSGTAFSASGPIAAGATVGSIAVAPAGWQGALSLSGANASSFTLSGLNLVAAAALAAGTYDVTVTATP